MKTKNRALEVALALYKLTFYFLTYFLYSAQSPVKKDSGRTRSVPGKKWGRVLAPPPPRLLSPPHPYNITQK